MSTPNDPTWQQVKASLRETWQLVAFDGDRLARVEATMDGMWRSTVTTGTTRSLRSQAHLSRDRAMLACELALDMLRGKTS